MSAYDPLADIQSSPVDLVMYLGAHRALRVGKCFLARAFVTSAIGGARTQHGLSDSRNRSSRHLSKFFLSSTD